ncbi:OmpA family protein [Hymenobacter sp. RP-2-7]|uniref:OmpA family protein n=1 Tax=Hymenobacter polaris TaxID=2682546 RepID=A0A7Y0ACP7_9BACT|nr:OmpA family protein [Hymenobacter polaris]NML64655.1 OmpA family protein [Hymenobacter polaris]
MKTLRNHYWLAALLLLLGSRGARAQSLAGTWQGVEDAEAARYYPAVLRLQRGQGERLFGILYQEVGQRPGITVTFEMEGARTATGFKLNHGRKLDETGASPFSYWCEGSISFTYDAAQEKLTGRAAYDPTGDCDTGEFIFYRVKLKSAPRVKAGALSTLRVSGRDVRWYLDAAHKQLVATGNTYATRLAKTTTFYITQGFYPSAQSQAVPITVQTTGTAQVPPVAARPTPRPATPAPAPKPAPTPAPRPAPDTARQRPAVGAPAPPILVPAGPAPLVLPTVLFKQATATLLPTSHAALDKLAAELQAQPQVRLRIVGHTDRLGESDKNQVLSEQRAAAVKAYLVKAGVAPERLETAGYGDTRLLYPSPDARNRRVEVERL